VLEREDAAAFVWRVPAHGTFSARSYVGDAVVWSIAKWRPGALVLAVALVVSSGSTGAAAVDTAGQSATLHFHRGREVLSFRLREPAGPIRLYRISAPAGAKVRGFAQLPGVTVPLRIATTATGPNSPCIERGTGVSCTVGEEGCPMPAGVWRFRFEKLAGPAGDVIVQFQVGAPASPLQSVPENRHAVSEFS
jgi:hypothetical protein